MKKIILIFLLAMVSVACNKAFEDTLNHDSTGFTATVETCNTSKTYTDEDHQVKWSKNDYVNIWYQRFSCSYVVSDVSIGKSTADLVRYTATGSSNSLDVNVAYYPYNRLLSCTPVDDYFKIGPVNLPSEQTYAPGTFANGLFPMVAVTSDLDDLELSFRNICGVLRIVLLGKTVVKKITVTGHNNEVLSGNFQVVAKHDESPTLKFYNSPSQAVTLDCGEGVQLSEDVVTTFDIVLPPVTFSDGFSINVNDGEEILDTYKPQTISRSSILRMGNKTIPENLSNLGTANCYLVSSAGDYMFSAVKGNTRLQISEIAGAELLWESFGTDEIPIKGDLISNVSYSNDVIRFTASDKKGNAVIAVKNADGNILWSWHIWLTDEPDGQVYSNNAGIMMDRNLGATSVTPGDVKSLGLLYQWGRKDPFLNARSLSEPLPAASTITWPEPVASNSTTGTIKYATENPMTLIGKSDIGNGDWQELNDDFRWLESNLEKGIYDPCPAGWRVPDGGADGFWSMASGSGNVFLSTGGWSDSYKGIDFSKTVKNLGSAFVWYPAAGYLDVEYGDLLALGDRGWYWSATPYESSAYSLDFGRFTVNLSSYEDTRAVGKSVRCVKEGSVPVKQDQTVNDQPLCFTANEAKGEISLIKSGNPDDLLLELSRDGMTWQDYSIGESVTFNQVGEKVYFRNKYVGNNTFSKDAENIYKFMIRKGKVSASGNVMSLIDKSMKAKRVPDYGFVSLFEHCTITTPPSLPATSLSRNCYERMFQGCKDLEYAPELPAKTMAEGCYSSMFAMCSLLSEAPVLPAEELAKSCYSSMFSNCISIREGPELPALNLAEDCYSSMFEYCASLWSAPELPAVDLLDNCYSYMFSNCSRLRYITVHFEEWNSKACINWMKGVSQKGIFNCPFKLQPRVKMTGGSANTIPNGWQVENYDVNEGENPLCFTALTAGSSVSLERKFTVSLNDVSLEYSMNMIDWSNYRFGQVISLPKIGSRVYFRNINAYSGNSSFSKDGSDHYYFTMTGRIAASGDVMSLIDYSQNSDFVPEGCFMYLFDDCTSLVSAPLLPATKLSKGCYQSMFDGCSALESAPDLPAETLAESCYRSMFSGCSSLKSAPDLPAENLAPYCYSHMFSRCTSLVEVHDLNALTLQESCYSDMFLGCSRLVKAPAIKAKKLARLCCIDMFLGCKALKTAPQLYATRMEESCYFNMFNGCSNLESAPQLMADILAPSCYSGMFQSCSSLGEPCDLPATRLASDCYQYMFSASGITEIPELKATVLAPGCYRGMFARCRSLTSAIIPEADFVQDCYAEMFDGCSYLNSLEVHFTSWNINATENWLRGVAREGVFKCPEALSSPHYVSSGNYSMVPTGWVVTNDNVCANSLCFTAKQNGASLSLKMYRFPNTISLEISSDAITWDNYSVGTLVNLENEGDKVYFRSSSDDVTGFSKDLSNYYYFEMSGSIAASGNVMSLIDRDMVTYSVPDYCFANLFEFCSSLISAPDLPAYTVGQYAYSTMFRGCGLEKAPELPALNIGAGSYEHMFDNCFSLKEAPALPATTLRYYCYRSMFDNCRSLVKAPELPASYLKSCFGCYQSMFSGCTSLVNAPELPATVLDNDCYSEMFRGCTALENFPALPATSLKDHCYYGMFYGCSSLRYPPSLPAQDIASYCYSYMFYGCSSLVNAPSLPSKNLAYNCYSYMFYGCSSLVNAPSLPAKNLASNCYSYMFYGCKSLEKAPSLPAENLESYCYSNMFNQCSKLSYISVGFSSWLSGATTNWISGVSSKGIFRCPVTLQTETTDYVSSQTKVSVIRLDKIPEHWVVINSSTPSGGNDDFGFEDWE